MSPDLERIIESKRAFRKQLAEKPAAEKLRIVEELAERTLATRKDTSAPLPEVPWQIPGNWRWSRMGDVATIIGGSTPRTDRHEYFGGDIPWITPADLSKYNAKTISRGARNITKDGLENSGAHLLPAGTVLFSSRAPIGYVAIAANPVATNQGFKSFVLRDELLPDFVYYYLQRAKEFAVALASGTTFLEISAKNAARLPIPVPPLDEQRQIVAEIEKQFTRLEAGVAALRRVQANLKRYRAAVLKAACEGWPTVPLSDVCEVVSGYAFKSSDFGNEGVPVVKIANVSYGSYLDEAPSFLPRTFLPEFRRFQIQAGDILLALTRPITNNQVKTCLYPQDLPNALLNQRVAKLAPTERILRGYLLAYLRSEYFKSAITTVMPQTLQPNLSPRDLAAMPIPLPPLPEQTRIVAEVERRLSVVEELEAVVSADLQRAARLRQSILQKAFIGELV